MKFSLIDEIREFEAGKSIVIVKNLTRAEEYLADHFPGFPVMPGVMMLETLVQASAWLMRVTNDFEHSTIVLDEAKALRFKSFVAPGDQMIVTSTVHKTNEDVWTFKASGKVEDTETVSARLALKQFSLKTSNESLAHIDERMTSHFRESWKELNAVVNGPVA